MRTFSHFSPALILGPIIYPKWYRCFAFNLTEVMKFLNQYFFKFIIFKPCFTIALFNPTKGTTSQIVPNETKSK